MLGSFKKIIEGVFSKAIYDLSKYLLIIFLSGMTGIVAHIYALHTKYLISYAIIFAISIAAAIGSIGIMMYKHYSPLYRIYLKTDFKYLLLKKECIYEYVDMQHMIYQKHVKLKVLCKTLDRYYDKYNWSGYGKTKISSDDEAHEIFLTTKRDAYQQFEVHFGRNYKKGEIIELHLTYEFEDLDNKAFPMLSSTIVEPTEYLLLIVKVPKKYNIEKADEEVFPIIDSRIALEKNVRNFNNNGVIEWEILNPRMLLVYSIRWVMPEQN